jgi:hypothetical protein
MMGWEIDCQPNGVKADCSIHDDSKIKQTYHISLNFNIGMVADLSSVNLILLLMLHSLSLLQLFPDRF